MSRARRQIFSNQIEAMREIYFGRVNTVLAPEPGYHFSLSIKTGKSPEGFSLFYKVHGLRTISLFIGLYSRVLSH